MGTAWDSSHAPAVPWHSGPWSLELRDDELADVRFDGRRVLRSIRAVVRDRDWNTASWVIERVTETGSTLEILAHTEGFGAEFRGALRLEAADDALVVSFDGVWATRFETNRTGLVVLHPPHLAGNALAIVHSDGSTERSSYPVDISPHQPALDIARLSWHDDGLDIGLRFTGDTFEMEDQRNWSDASFKTYSRPLSLPYPYTVGAGERIRQEITISVREEGPATVPPPGATIALRRGGAFPEILVGASTAPDPGPPPLPSCNGVVVELDLGTSNWRAALGRARASGLPLDVRVILAPERSVDGLRELADALHDIPVLRAAAFDPNLHITDGEALASLRSAFADVGITLPIVGGARSHFTEYNRSHARIPGDLDGVVVATTPLFHTLGTEQLVESLAIQRLIAEQTVAMAGGTPVHIGPVTLRPRFNNVATQPEAAPRRFDLAEGYGPEFTGGADPRQSEPELAAWTIASAAALAIPHVASIAWFEEWGPRGIRSTDGSDLPVANALRALAGLAGRTLLFGDSPDGKLWAVGGALGEDAVVLLANLHDDDRRIQLTVDDSDLTVDIPRRRFLTVQLQTNP